MNRDLSCYRRIELLKELHKIYFVDFVHEVEDQGQYGIAGWDVTVKYKAKIGHQNDGQINLLVLNCENIFCKLI